MSQDIQLAEELQKDFKQLKTEISKVIVGQEEAVDLVLISILCNAHSLLVGVPGLAKTLLIKTISSALHLDFNRVQFTPDLMPSDILGAETMNSNREFQFIKGPIFANIVLADEINRTPPKTQSALLEAMQEKSVTIGGKLYKLPEPFFVLATQNPIEQEGTYPLPEAQLDRFMFSINLDYPSFQDELDIVKRTTGANPEDVNAILNAEKITEYRELIKKVPVVDNVVEYAVKLVHKTRPTGEHSSPLAQEYLDWGAGPRASQNLIMGAKCLAILKGKYSPDIEEVKEIAIPILKHRILVNFKADADGYSEEKILKELMG